MPFAELDTVTVTGTYLMLDETPAQGTVTFEISDATLQALQDATGNQIIVPQVVIVALDASGPDAGSFSVDLPATDDPDVSPTGFTYRVTENIAGASGNRPRVYDIVVPEGSVGGILDLADVAPVVVLPGISTYILLPEFNALEQRVFDLEEFGVPGGIDSDLTQIGNLDPNDDSFLQRKAGVWVDRTPTQAKTDLAIVQGDVSGLTAALAAKAATASPALTGTPTTPDPTTATGIANKQWVESIASSQQARAEVQYASMVPLPANTYANGTLGVGATLTGNANGALVIDGVTLAAGQVDQEVLVAGQATLAHNGWYVVTRVGTGAATYELTRRVPEDQAAEIGPGYLTPVKAPAGFTAGTDNDNKVYLSSAPTPFVVGTDALTFTPVGGTYAAGNGIILVGNQFALDPGVAVDLDTPQTLVDKTLTDPILENPTADIVTVEGEPGTNTFPMEIKGRAKLLVPLAGTYEIGNRIQVSDDASFDPFDVVCTVPGTVGVGAGPTFAVVGREVILAAAASATTDAIDAIPELAIDTSLTQTTAGGVMTIGSKNPVLAVQRETDDRVRAGANPNWATENATPNGDNVLTLPAEANSLYKFELFIIYNCTATADARFVFARPAGAQNWWTSGGLVPAATSAISHPTSRQFFTAGTNAQVGGIGAGNNAVATIIGTLRTFGTAGDFAFLAAQWVAEQTDIWIMTGSWFVMTKLA